jgi:hypothetical protein
LEKLASDNFEFEALVIGKGRRHHRLKAMVDTGSTVNVLNKKALKIIGISNDDIQHRSNGILCHGFNGMVHNLNTFVELEWGKAKYNGDETQVNTFNLLAMPEGVDMVLAGHYLKQEILERARRTTRSDSRHRS